LGSIVSTIVPHEIVLNAMFLVSASILGIHVSYANEFHDYEVVPVSVIDAPLTLIPIHSNIIHRDLWVSISFDHVSYSTTPSIRIARPKGIKKIHVITFYCRLEPSQMILMTMKSEVNDHLIAVSRREVIFVPEELRVNWAL